jgi:hypothetical protein
MALVKLNNRGVRSASAFGSITGLGSMVFIKKQTASSSSTISFVDGTSDVVLDDTYKEYLFTFNNMHPETNSRYFGFKGSINTGSAYGVATTSTVARAYHNESGSPSDLEYESGLDLAQGTGLINLSTSVGNGNDECCSGYLHLFNPSSTTFVKHFTASVQGYEGGDYSIVQYVAGYINTTSAVDAIQFSYSSGDTDAGDICLYGIN